MRFLYVTTIGGTMRFFRQLIKELVEAGHTVDIAANTSVSAVPEEYAALGCKIFPISCTRSPLNKGTLIAVKELKRIVGEGNYDIVHCHTPIAAMCTRLACRKARKHGTKVFYTAHGFHFYKGAPLKNWLLYYPVEKVCAHFTDVLITINQEDYALAQKKLRAGKVEYVPGVGIDVAKFSDTVVDRDKKRDEIGVPRDAAVLLSVGDLNKNKNHETVIRAIADLNVYYMIAGKGGLREYLQDLIEELGLSQRVKLLGFRQDVAELYKAADVFILPSVREGLNVSVMEAMASGLPVICGEIRGNVDMIDRNGGFLFDPLSIESCKKAIDDSLRSDQAFLGNYNLDKVQTFAAENVNPIMKELYNI